MTKKVNDSEPQVVAPVVDDATVVPTAPVVEQTPVVASERDVAWAAFLERARAVNPERFDRQKANGEFNKIPDNWNG